MKKQPYLRANDHEHREKLHVTPFKWDGQNKTFLEELDRENE